MSSGLLNWKKEEQGRRASCDIRKTNLIRNEIVLICNLKMSAFDRFEFEISLMPRITLYVLMRRWYIDVV